MDKIFSIPPGDILLWFVVFLFSLSFHESAHAWTSYKFGDDTGRLQGRITLNPIAHIDPIGTILFPLLSFVSGGIALFGWAKPVQTNPLLWRDKTKANIWVSAAGPISNFIIATVSFSIIKILLMSGVMRQAFREDGGVFNLIVPVAQGSAFLMPIATLLSIFLTLNIILGVFNLIPIPPLDGSHVLESLLPASMSEAYAQIRPFGFILLLGLMWATPVFSWILSPVFHFVRLLLFGT